MRSRHAGINAYKCSLCDFSTPLLKHMAVIFFKILFFILFFIRMKKKKHSDAHAPSFQIHQCEICGEPFLSRTELIVFSLRKYFLLVIFFIKMHNTTHISFNCEFCLARFRTEDELKVFFTSDFFR